MSNFVPSNMHLREVLLHYLILKKTAAESHRLLVEAYSDHALSETTCRDWFKRFKSGDFDLDNRNVVNLQRNLKIQNCKVYWTKMMLNLKNN